MYWRPGFVSPWITSHDSKGIRMPYHTDTARSIEELLEKVLTLLRQMPESETFWYRGINCDKFELCPKIMREGHGHEAVFAREKRLLTRFRQRSLPYWPEGYPQNDWEQLFAMQHYGVPTRLLDWSENLFIATYFALQEPIIHEHPGQCKPVIWCMDPIKWNRAAPGLSEFGNTIRILATSDDEAESYRPETPRPHRPKTPVAIFGSHNSRRIVAQQGNFTVWGSENKPMEHFANIATDTLLWKLILTGERKKLYRELRMLGFSETMIFPELTSVATELTLAEGW